MRKIFPTAFLPILVALLTTSCSLFNVDLNTGVEPLPSKELNTRILLHDFANDYSAQVEHVADSIILSTTDKTVRMQALHWKINTTSMSRQLIFQTVPYASLVDTWTFCRQQKDFFSVGNGSTYFNEYLPSVQAVCQKLEDQVAFIARIVSKNKEYSTYSQFVDEYASAHPFRSMDFSRKSLLTDLNNALGIPDSAAVATVGTMPEAISDLSSRMNDYSKQLPKMTKWRTQAWLMESGVDSVNIVALMDSINLLTSRIAYIADNSPELLDSALLKLNAQLTPLVNKFDRRWSETLWKLGEERIALIDALDSQRVAISETVAVERGIIMKDLNVLSNELVERSWVHIKQLIMRSLFLILLILIVMLGLPFGLGYLTGRTLKIKKNSKSEQV